MGATVELDIFSGRPNPRWMLSSSDAQRLCDFIEKAAQHEKVSSPEQLGYRGIFVTDLQTCGGDPVNLRIGNGVIATQGQSSSDWLADPGQQLELWLIDTGRGQIDDKILDWALTDAR